MIKTVHPTGGRMQLAAQETIRFNAAPTNDPLVEQRLNKLSRDLRLQNLGIITAPDDHSVREVRLIEEGTRDLVSDLIDQHQFTILS